MPFLAVAPDITGCLVLSSGTIHLPKKWGQLALVVPRRACVGARWGGGGRPRRAGAALLGFVAFATCSSSTVACGLWQGPPSR
jgi:hypothetical protein